MAASDKKDTIYVDVDDEITAVIEKVRSSTGKVVALVLPKRATVLQSVVNMKLLKRTAEAAKKHLVLVTTEASLLPLAGNVGLHVAATPTSKPSIPPVVPGPGDETENVDESFEVNDGNKASGAEEDYDPAALAAMPVGELADSVAASKISPSSVDEELSLDDEPAVDVPAAAAGAAEVIKPKKNKKLAVPNFDTFRKKLLLAGVLLVLLVVGYIFAFIVLPKATVTIQTDTSTITTTMNVTLDTTAKALDTTNKIVPATVQTNPKSTSQQVAATGQQNNGTKATGTVNMSAGSCSGSVPNGVDAGTGVTTGGHTYILGSAVSFTPTVTKGKCTFTGVDGNGKTDIGITALKGGTEYNTSTASFTVPGRSDVSASGSASDGTDNITKIVSQADIDGATAKLTAQDTTTIKTGLQAVLQGKGLQAITSSFLAGDPVVTTSAKAGDAADTVTVTSVTTYTMLGVKESDLASLVDASVTKQLDKGRQSILDDGVAKATITPQSAATATSAALTVHTKSVVGPQIDADAIKKQILGKKSGDISSLIKQTPGVTDVTVKYSPFWVGKTPSNPNKVTVQVDKANTGNQ